MELMRTKQAAAFLGVTRTTLRSWVKRGLIPRVEVSPRITRFRRQDLEEFFKSRVKTAAAQ